jgi:hypothetical protein
VQKHQDDYQGMMCRPLLEALFGHCLVDGGVLLGWKPPLQGLGWFFVYSSFVLRGEAVPRDPPQNRGIEAKVGAGRLDRGPLLWTQAWLRFVRTLHGWGREIWLELLGRDAEVLS